MKVTPNGSINEYEGLEYERIMLSLDTVPIKSLYFEQDTGKVFKRTAKTWVQIFGPAFDGVDDMLKIKSMQKKWRESFPGAALRPAMWDVIQSGMPYSVSGGLLRFASGVAPSVKTVIQSKEIFTIPLRLCIGSMLSQRIANQKFTVELVSCNEDGVVDEANAAAWILDGASATTGLYSVKNEAGAPLVSPASTIASTASFSILETELYSDEAWFHSRVLDSANARSNSYVRHRDIPNPNALYKLRLTAENLGTAPASATNWDVLYTLINDYAELTAEITAGRGNSVAGQGIFVNAQVVGGSVSQTPASPNGHTLESAATTNATLVKGSGGNLLALAISNLSASTRYLKLYNKASAPVVGTDIPIATIPVVANSHYCTEYGAQGMRFTAGIAYALTGGPANADAVAIGANEVKVHLSFT